MSSCFIAVQLENLFQFVEAFWRSFAFHYDVAVFQIIVDMIIVRFCSYNIECIQQVCFVVIIPVIAQNTPFDSITDDIRCCVVLGRSSKGISIASIDVCRLLMLVCVWVWVLYFLMSYYLFISGLF